MSSEELENKVTFLKQELFDLRFQLALGKLTNTAQIRKLKKSIARIKTILTQKNTNFKSTLTLKDFPSETKNLAKNNKNDKILEFSNEKDDLKINPTNPELLSNHKTVTTKEENSES
ncbi:LSU ribosomal protein L29p [Candidatus Phytoplasma solani]